ncbi:hypothetical protein BD324DRAFT_578511 [Kockovaella imperatae]|uniref:DUF6534 domain-containing protein n=1 Tax=Kockovaella imperatae TaxID=4999 RepID=A0A1Y1UKK9_9TREE|nr:hypothetical protein BD324DRAFT_578511 [Kockovaella imperatae]ORX37665.1 hypothetical protein BD324DRAFT_578511 [Kockovaella imperatae]
MAVPSTEAEIAANFAPEARFSLGCMFAEVVIDTFLAGILTMQVWTYFKYQMGDARWIKFIVIATAALNAGVTAFIWYFIQYLFVENFGLWAPFAETRLTVTTSFPVLDSVNSGIVQSFFAYRAYRLCNRKIVIPIVVGILIVMSFGATLANLVMFGSAESLFQAADVTVPVLIWLCSIMTADLIITVCILYGLTRSRTGWSHTDRTITRLVRMTLEAQVPPTLLAIAFIIEFVITPASLLGGMLEGIQCKLYAVGLLYALNVRVTLQQRFIGDNETKQGQVFAMSNRPTQKTQLQIDVETETHVQVSIGRRDSAARRSVCRC